MQRDEPYNHISKINSYLNERARQRITLIQKNGRFVEKSAQKQSCCPECGHTIDPYRIPCCKMDRKLNGKKCSHWNFKNGAVHSIIPSTKVFLISRGSNLELLL